MWELDNKESWALKNWCFWTVVLEKTLESPLDYKEIQKVHPKGDQSWMFIGRTDVEAETPVLWRYVWSWNSSTLVICITDSFERPWCWEGLRAGGEGDDRGWDGWMASLTQWTWVWVGSGGWCWTGRPGVLRFMGSQRIGHSWATELNWVFHYVHVSHLLYPFIYQWAFRSFPWFGYCEQCCYEPSDVCIFELQFSLGILPGVDCWIMW